MAVILAGAGDISVYRGTVLTNNGNKLVLLMKGGQQKTFALRKGTRVFVGNTIASMSAIKRNFGVEVAVDASGDCLQIVTMEVPK